MSRIAVDRQHAIVFARIAGYLDVEQVLQFSARIDDVVSGFGDRSHEHARLIDLSAAKVASPDTIDALAREIANPARRGVQARRVGYFGASPLLARQIERLCALRPGMALLRDRQSGYAWVRSDTR